METSPESTPERRQILKWIGHRVSGQEKDPTFLPINIDVAEDKTPVTIIQRGAGTIVSQQSLENDP